jgi:MFS family permease
MMDILGAIVLGALAVATAAVLVLASPLDLPDRRRLLGVGIVWLAAVAGLGAAGVFTTFGIGAIAAAILAPLAIALVSAARPSAIRTAALGVPLALLVLANVGRILGAFFLVLHEHGRLPRTFALSAGWGDIAVALLAIPVAWLAHRGAPSWRSITLAWNAVAFVDLVAAVTLGVGSTPGSPVRFIYEEAVPGTIGTLPWVLIPAFLVPLYFLTHLAVFARLLREVPARVALHAGH